MRALVQRVTSATVTVGGREIARIDGGLCAFVGVTHDDDEGVADRLADRLWGLRVFDDADRAMNLAAADVGGGVLVVSQFTLYGDTRRGRRPSWAAAAAPEHAEPLVARVAERLRAAGADVATGQFGASMQVALVNDGPVTVMLEVNRRR